MLSVVIFASSIPANLTAYFMYVLSSNARLNFSMLTVGSVSSADAVKENAKHARSAKHTAATIKSFLFIFILLFRVGLHPLSVV